MLVETSYRKVMTFETICRDYLRDDAKVIEITDKETALEMAKNPNPIREDAGKRIWGTRGEWTFLDGIQGENKWIFFICKTELFGDDFYPQSCNR